MKKQVLAFSIAVMQILASFSGIAVKAASYENVNEEINCIDFGNYSVTLQKSACSPQC